MGGSLVGLMLFSPEWCDQLAESTDSDDLVYRGFRDPENFTYKFEFRTKDGLAMHVEWEAGRVTYCGPPKFGEEELFFVIEAGADAFRSAAEREFDASRLLMGGRIKMLKGPISTAVENVGAFNEFFRGWENIQTDWPS